MTQAGTCFFISLSWEVSSEASRRHERIQPPSMTRIVNSLVEGGFVGRRAHETDGRQVVVVLSERGRTTLLADRDRRDAWMAQRLCDLTPGERDTLRRAAPLLERLASAD